MNVIVAVSPLSPSVTTGESIDKVGTSSSIIVPVPTAVEIGVSDGFGLLSRIFIVSFASPSSSPVTVTLIVFDLSPATNVSVLPAKAA